MSNDTQAAATSASTAASAADEAAATVDAIVKRLNANRANTLALCAVLSVCEQRMPYRDAEALIDERPELSLSTQNAHALLRIMVDCGGVDAVEVPEPAYAPGEEKQDRPIDYTVQTTAAGLAALAQFEPTRRFLKPCATNLRPTRKRTPSCSPCARTARRRPPSSRRLRATPR